MNKPATPLPWRKSTTGLVCDQMSVPILASESGDAAYIVHACNAYPKLVEELRWWREECQSLISQGRMATGTPKRIAALLRELGEDK